VRRYVEKLRQNSGLRLHRLSPGQPDADVMIVNFSGWIGDFCEFRSYSRLQLRSLADVHQFGPGFYRLCQLSTLMYHGIASTNPRAKFCLGV